MSDTCPVVRIKTRKGWAELNEADFDPERHELFEAESETPDGTPTPIPADWSDLHHMKKIALAEKITGADLVLADGQTKTEAAEAVIKAEVERRAANG